MAVLLGLFRRADVGRGLPLRPARRDADGVERVERAHAIAKIGFCCLWRGAALNQQYRTHARSTLSHPAVLTACEHGPCEQSGHS